MRKRIIPLMLAAALICSLACMVPAAAAAGAPDYTLIKGASFFLNDEEISKMLLADVDGTVYCAVKKFFRATLTDASVVWVNAQAEVTGFAPFGEELTLTAKPGTKTMQVNGIDVPVPNGIRLINNTTMAPVELLASLFEDGSVSFDPETNTYSVTTGGWLAEITPPEEPEEPAESEQPAEPEEPAEPAPKAPLTIDEAIAAYQPSGNYDPQDLDIISRIINAEAGNQCLKGKIAVGNIILNRVASREFPNNVHDVVYQRNQFNVVYYASYQRTPSAESVLAAKMALDGINVVPGAVFYNVSGTSSWASRNRPYLTTVQGHDFYK